MCNTTEQMQRRMQVHTQQNAMAQQQMQGQQFEQQNVMERQMEQTTSQQTADPRELYQQHTANMTDTAKLGKTGFKARFAKTKVPAETAPAPVQPALLRTREEATHTHSVKRFCT